ncbi:response regulator transcription factor [Hydrogenophaga sp. 5NK40-0174]
MKDKKSEHSDILSAGTDSAAAFGFPDSRFNTDFSASVWPEFMVGQTDAPVRVLLVDDDPHMRQVISRELLSDLRLDLVAQAGSVKEAKRKIAQHEVDVMLVDLNLGDGTGFDLIYLLKSKQPNAESVVISAIEDEAHALQAFALGATGYLVKNSWFGSFPQAVLQVVNGGASITPNLARRLLQRLDMRGVAAPQPTNRERLSDREREILKMVAAGYTSVEIAERLSISAQTVNTHVRNIYRKLQVKTRAQAVTRAADQGLL